MIATLNDGLHHTDVFWLYPVYCAAMGFLESRARAKNREHLAEILTDVIRQEPAILERSVRTLFPKTAVWIPLIGASVIVAGMLLVRLDIPPLGIAQWLALGKPAYYTLALLLVAVVNDVVCIRCPPWPAGTFERLRTCLKGEWGPRILDRLALGDSPAARARLRKELAGEYLPDLFRPLLARLATQQGLRLSLSVTLVLCSVLARA